MIILSSKCSYSLFNLTSFFFFFQIFCSQFSLNPLNFNFLLPIKPSNFFFSILSSTHFPHTTPFSSIIHLSPTYLFNHLFIITNKLLQPFFSQLLFLLIFLLLTTPSLQSFFHISSSITLSPTPPPTNRPPPLSPTPPPLTPPPILPSASKVKNLLLLSVDGVKASPAYGEEGTFTINTNNPFLLGGVQGGDVKLLGGFGGGGFGGFCRFLGVLKVLEGFKCWGFWRVLCFEWF